MLTKADLRSLYGYLEKSYATDKQASETPTVERRNSVRGLSVDPPTITVWSANDIKTETESSDVFENDVLDLHKTLFLYLSYANYKRGKRIEIHLEETTELFSSERSNFISVSGNDPTWVEATFVEIERIFSAVRPQIPTARKLKWPIRLIFPYTIGRAFVSLILLTITTQASSERSAFVQYLLDHPPLVYLTNTSLMILLGLVPTAFLTMWLEKLWPRVEFDFGPEHLKTRKLMRSRFAVGITVLALPLLVDALKNTC